MNTGLFAGAMLLALTTGAFGCVADTTDAPDLVAAEDELVGGRAGAVYTLTNDVAGNEVIVFRRADDGTLERAATYSTGGAGSGDGLGSQGALVFSRDRGFLYAVNAGSNELSVFRVRGEQLYLLDCIPTGGVRPISVTVSGNVSYVLHAGDATTPGGIAAFYRTGKGALAPLADSGQPLSGASVGPAQISFSPSSRALLVTEKGTNKIVEYRVGSDALASAPLVHDSSGTTPFGFAITRTGAAIVSEAFGGAPAAGAVSSYQLSGLSGLAPISASVGSSESAPCWVVLSSNDRVAFVSNTASGSISSYEVGRDGTVSVSAANGARG